MPFPQEYFANIKSSPSQIFIGITGGIGSGKSAVAAIIREEGYTVFSADDIGRELTNTDEDIKNSINREFGQMFLADGTIDRIKMAALVFGDTQEQKASLQRLNAIIHPAVWRTVGERVKSAFAAGQKIIFNETALLFEAGAEAVYDVILVVDADEEVRIQRLAEGRKITPEEARQRILSQMSVEQKKARADYIISNNGSREDLRSATLSVLHQICSRNL